MQLNEEYSPMAAGIYGSTTARAGSGCVPGVQQSGPTSGLQHTLPALQQLPAITTAGGQVSPVFPTTPATVFPAGLPGAIPAVQIPVTVESAFYTAGFLRTQIGRRVRVEFLLGTNLLTDRTGTLVAVGASYIVLRPIDSDDLIMCDIYSIRFVTIIL